MAKKYGVASDYIKYTSRIKSDTSDGVAVEASQVVDLEEDKLQSDINKELKALIASAGGNTYSKSEIDGKDTATLTSAKSYTDEKVSALGSVYTTKGSCTAAQLKALTSAKAGDVWNITDAITIDGKAYPAGVNVVCVTTFSSAIDPAATKNWDALQGLQDLTSYAKKSEIDAVAGRIQGVKIYESSTAAGFIIQNAEYDNLKATIGTDVHIESNINIRTGANIGSSNIGDGIDIRKQGNGASLNGSYIGSDSRLSDNASIGRDVYIYEGVNIDKYATIGTESIGTSLVAIHDKYAGKIAIGNGVQIAKGVGIAVNDEGVLVWGKEIEGSYQVITAATANDISALVRRVSALEDLLKLA